MSFFPILKTLQTYSFKKFRFDFFAGLTLSLFLIPESMAYANLAGLPTVFGIYSALSGGLFFALFTSTDKVAVGPTSTLSLMIGSTVGLLSNGSIETHVAIVSLTTFMVFVFCIFAYFIHLNSLLNFIADHVLVGFKIGVALTIASSQIPLILGLTPRGENFFQKVFYLFRDLPQVDFLLVKPALIFGSILLILNYFFKNKPVSILLVLLSLGVAKWIPDVFENIPKVGNIPEGLPVLTIPKLLFKDVDSILGLSFGCFLIAYIETTSVSRAMEEQRSSIPNLKQELISIGAANFASTFAGGLPVSGGLTQSEVNSDAGAVSPVALLVSTSVIIALLLFFPTTLSSLPLVLLPILVLFALRHLFRIKALQELYRLKKSEFVLAIITIVAVLFFGILKGILISSVLSILYILAKASNPHLAILGRIPNTNNYSDIQFHADNLIIPKCLILKPESPIYYFNQQNIFETILAMLDKYPDTRLLILDLSASSNIDVAGSKMIVKLSDELQQKNISFKIVMALVEVREILRKQDLEKAVGHISRRVTLNEVVENFEKDNH